MLSMYFKKIHYLCAQDGIKKSVLSHATQSSVVPLVKAISILMLINR